MNTDTDFDISPDRLTRAADAVIAALQKDRPACGPADSMVIDLDEVCACCPGFSRFEVLGATAFLARLGVLTEV